MATVASLNVFLESKRDIETLWSNLIPSESWRQTTKCGRLHRWTENGGGVVGAKWVVLEPGDDEYPERGEWRCRRCGGPVHPETRSGSIRIAGPRYFLIDGEPVTEAEYQEAVNRFLLSVRE